MPFPSPGDLRAYLELSYPLNATCWSQATDEVRDLSRTAREVIGFSELHACNFESLDSPAAWNIFGIASIVRFYEHMTPAQKLAWYTEFAHLINPVK